STSVLRLRLSLFQSTSDHRALHSFPTRRSSDLLRAASSLSSHRAVRRYKSHSSADTLRSPAGSLRKEPSPHSGGIDAPQLEEMRSEEHTSELQSRENLVCRLLLEKTNTTLLAHS